MRKEPWEFIEKAMFGVQGVAGTDGPRMLVVTGMGGCGKTQLILKFIQVHKNK
jgi:GTPase SAR1 family protein